MSMVLKERLNTFLTQTGALSREQVGFRRKSGTSEAVLALSEVVRNAAKDSAVLTAFVDVRAAYDSVIREVLYAKMLRMGIGGNFLTTMHGSSTTLQRPPTSLSVLLHRMEEHNKKKLKTRRAIPMTNCPPVHS